MYKESLVDPNTGREFTVENDMKNIREAVRSYLQTPTTVNEFTIRRYDWKNTDHLLNNSQMYPHRNF